MSSSLEKSRPPSESEAEVFTALSFPGVLGPQGQLYVLREDGAIVEVAAPQSGEGNLFHVLSGPVRHPWLLATRGGYFLLEGRLPYVLGPAEDFLWRTHVLPDYPEAFAISGDSGSDHVVLNGPRGLAVLSAGPSGVSNVGFSSPTLGFAGWRSGSELLVAGMLPRKIKESEKHYSLKFGEAAILTLDLEGRSATVQRAAGAIDARAAGKLASSLAGGEGPSLVPGRDRVECWLAAVPWRDRRVLIGTIVNPGSAEWEWGEISEQPAWTDSALLGFFLQNEAGLEPVRLDYPYSFVQAQASNGAWLVYLLHHGSSEGFQPTDLHYLIVGEQFGAARPAPLAFAGLQRGERLARFRTAYDERVGYYGILSVFREVGSMESFLITGTDGTSWRVVQSLGTRAYVKSADAH